MNDYNRIKTTLENMTPSPDDFSGEIYPASEVEADKALLAARKLSPEYKKLDKDHESKVLERAFTDAIEQDDWFSEYSLYADDPDWIACTTIPTSEIDDTFNHIDTIALISNELTDHEVVPFAIDLTYNTSSEGISQKFNWPHVWGKNPNSPAASSDVSEFGTSWTERTPSGTFTIKSKPLPLKSRNGLKIPGFASAKYFEDKNGTDLLEKGRITIMPRFVVGFHPDIAQTLAGGNTSEDYDTASAMAKCCTLSELCEQSTAIKNYLDSLPEEKISQMDAQELSTARTQISQLDEYFHRSLSELESEAKSDPALASAFRYVSRDPVAEKISAQSYLTYR